MRSPIGEEPGIVHTGIRRLEGVESPGYSCPGSHASPLEAIRPERQEEPSLDSQLRSVRCAWLRGSMARAVTELCGPRLKVGLYTASKGMMQCQPRQRFGHTRAKNTATNLGVLLLTRHLWGDYTTPRWLLGCCGCKASRRKIHREGWRNNSGTAAKAAVPRRLP